MKPSKTLLAAWARLTGLPKPLLIRKHGLQSNIATNVDIGALEVGTKMGGSDIGIDIGERVKEVMATNNTDVTEALRQVKDEFNAAMRQVVENLQQQQDAGIQMQILEVLNSINRNQGRTADASQRMADVAMN